MVYINITIFSMSKMLQNQHRWLWYFLEGIFRYQSVVCHQVKCAVPNQFLVCYKVRFSLALLGCDVLWHSDEPPARSGCGIPPCIGDLGIQLSPHPRRLFSADWFFFTFLLLRLERMVFPPRGLLLPGDKVWYSPMKPVYQFWYCKLSTLEEHRE